MSVKNIPLQRERLILANTMLKLTRLFNKAVFHGVGSQSEAVHVLQAIFFGHLSGHPMTAHKISLSISVPRTTVLRKLDLLARLGFVHQNSGLYYITDAKLEKSAADLDSIIGVIVDAADALRSSPNCPKRTQNQFTIHGNHT
jgi:hypothetical protein